MDPASTSAREILELVLGFLERNLWKIIVLVVLIVARKSIGGLIERIIKFRFSWGGASGDVEAVPPSISTTEGASTAIESRTAKGTPQETDPLELQEKEEETKDWFPAMHNAFLSGDIERAKEVFESYGARETDADSRHSSEALYLNMLYTYGNDPSALTQLELLHNNSASTTQLGDSALWLSLSYGAAKDYKKAESVWQDAIQRAGDEPQRTEFIVSLAYVYRNEGSVERAIELLEQRLSEVDDSTQRAAIYRALSTNEEDRADEHAAAIALEKSVELSPGNRETLFNAAYAQSKAKLRLLSVSNYRTLINLNPHHGTALNNLGVCANEFDVNGRAVTLYRKASDEGNTLGNGESRI